MDDSWRVKCGSTLPFMASSTTLEAGNQTEVNAGRYFYPHVGQDLRLQAQGRMPDPMFANVTSLSSYSSGHADLGNSFLALLSGPASLLQCDFQELSNPRQFSTSTKIPIDRSNVVGNIVGSWGQLKSNGIPSENVSYRSQRNGADLSPVVSSRAACSSNSVLEHDLQSANICLQRSDVAKAVIHHTFPGTEKVNDFSSLKGECYNSTPANAVKLPSTNSQMLQTQPLQSESSVSKNSSTLTGGCPRVFCFCTTGDLLLSNTGLLGILCSCHCFHMSVSKFCEHSGLQNVNPGDAVHLESGETISQWRKLYFQKFGIRVPEDQSGWDWPEGLSLTSSLVKSSVSTALPKNSDCIHPDSCSGGLVGSGRPIDNNVFPKNPLADQSSNQNSVIDAFHNEQQRNGGKKFLGLGGTLQSNSPVVVDNTPHTVTDIAISRFPASAKFVGKGPESGCQSMAANIDDIVKSGNLSTANPTLQNLRALFRSNDVNRAKYGKDGAIIDRDVASSSIELRLGQPSQQIQPLGNPFLAPARLQVCNIPVDSQKPFREQMIHYGTSCRGEEESRQCLPHIADVANSIQRREQHQLNDRRCAINNTIDFAQLEKCQSNMDKDSMFSPFKHFNPPPVGVLPFRSTNNAVNISEHTTRKTLPGESNAVKHNAVNASWNGGNGLERQWKDSEFGFFRPADQGKDAGCLTSSCFVETSLESKMHEWMKNQSSSTRVAVGNSYSGFSATHEKNHSSCHLTRTPPPPDASDAGILSNYPCKVPCFGSHVDHVFPGAIGSCPGSRQILPSQAVSIGLPSSPSTSISGLTPALLKQDTIGAGPYLLEDNLRLLALRQILELSKQQHEMSSLGKNPEQGRCDDSSNVKLQHCWFEPSAFGFHRQAANSTSKRDVSESAMKSIHSTPVMKIGDGVDKFAHLTGLNNWCNFSTMTQGMPLCSKEMDKQCELSHDQLETEQPSLRLGRIENTTIHSNELESCCQIRQYFQTYCSCAAHKNCLGSKCNCTGGNPRDSREQMGCANDKVPTLIASKIVKDQTFPHEATISLDHCSKFRGQVPKNLSCYASQWKDVPSKTKEVCKVVCMDQSAGILDGRQSEFDHLADTTAKCFDGAVHMTDSFKEQEISNISSGCSAPAVTQATVEVNNLDSTVVAGSNRCLKHLIVDEGSGIDKSWSSVDAPESDRSADFCGSTSKTRLRKDGSFEVINHKSSRSLLDDVKLMDSFTWKRGQNQIHAGISVHQKINHSLESDGDLKIGKRKREMKLKLLDASKDPAVHAAEDKYHKFDETAERPCLSKDVQMASSGRQKPRISSVSSIKPSSKRGKPSLSMSKPPSRKRDVHRLYNERYGEDNTGARTASNNNSISDKNIEVSGRKKFRSSMTCDTIMLFQECEPIHAVGEKTVNCDSLSHVNVSLSLQVNGWNRNARPVVCGKYGEISSGKIAGKQSKPAKIVSLDTIFKTTKKCTLPKNCNPKLTSVKDLKRARSSWSNACFYKFSNMKKENTFAETSKHSTDESLMLEKENKDKTGAGCSILDSNTRAHSRPKLKEIRRRSLNELTLKGKNLGSAIISHKKVCAPKTKTVKIPSSSEDSYCCIRGSLKVDAKRCIQEQKHLSVMDSESFCCVCGSSNKDEVNCLLECGQCSIKVHQACYGVPKVPKGHWYCRPCRIGSKNIICVMCGYGGGAMTQALRTRTLAKSLLKAWSFETECRPNISLSSSENLQNELSILHSSESVPENSPHPVLRHVNDEPSTSSVSNIDMPNQLDILPNSLRCVSNLKVHNSITAGILDSTVRQWVHMVCGLWTPGTRCPNVDTMSAFDVSGASHPQANMVCSICNRAGGSCIECRVVNCSVHFHPWCAHQKGLLQSEVEGADNENVGFYGRCVLHATYPTDEYACDAASGEKDESCARTKGYKGRKRDGFWHNLHGQYKSKGGCLVPQEQLNAWVHINAQKTSAQVLSKLPMSDVEHDCRKEYARYKQVKGWKYLVVYKSGIHALGLYTSRFIYRGEMVVEYVGEIVGQRVADKREIEYQSGRKLQYKSACYFFRIDREHIIDATRKGGIARFVNHSCLPNCVAKVISVRNDKKVVFFAERDIYPGEEITYDYHFNHEDEGKKIPCFCNSKNCRRYLN